MKRAILLLLAILSISCQAQQKSNMNQYKTKEKLLKYSNKMENYNGLIRLMKDSVLVFPDGLKIKLRGFSRKKIFNGRYEANAQLEISDNHSKEPLKIIIHKTVYRDEQDNIITNYKPKEYKNYKIELIDLSYGESINIVVFKIR